MQEIRVLIRRLKFQVNQFETVKQFSILQVDTVRVKKGWKLKED